MIEEKKILVSVIIPTYKRTDLLLKAIDSVLNQTYKNIEVLVVDDNEPATIFRENTENIMKKYDKDNRVRYIKHSSNKNGAAARNTGIAYSYGEYIEFLDDDDIYLPMKTEIEVEFLNKNLEHHAVYCGRIQNGKNVVGEISGDLSEIMLLSEFMPTTPALMFRKNALLEIGGFNENFKRHQEVEMLLRFFERYTIGCVSQILVSISEISGENEIHGIELENNKKLYLKTFDEKIEKIDIKTPGFKKNVYCKHMSMVICDHIQQGHLKKFINMYSYGCKISFFQINYYIIIRILSSIGLKIYKIRGRK